jgi:hypothetical protein
MSVGRGGTFESSIAKMMAVWRRGIRRQRHSLHVITGYVVCCVGAAQCRRAVELAVKRAVGLISRTLWLRPE